ncbi:hypothetical protein CNR22_04385 [Sphingobacteriaceae bacterium]|nr:hypothetical protein CNR22_04385 [Sphingobacteriaceae bacterium]
MRTNILALFFFLAFFIRAQTPDSIAGTYTEVPMQVPDATTSTVVTSWHFGAFPDPQKISCELTLTENKYASRYTKYYVMGMKYREYGKWKLKGDTLVITLTKSSCNIITVEKEKSDNIQTFPKPRVHYYVWKDDLLVELVEEGWANFRKKN